MPKSKPVYSFDRCERYQNFLQQLRDAGVVIETVWQARKNGAPVSAMREQYPDIECIMFRGPHVKVPMAIVTLHTGAGAPADPREIGFNLFFISPNNAYDNDLDTIVGKKQ